MLNNRTGPVRIDDGEFDIEWKGKAMKTTDTIYEMLAASKEPLPGPLLAERLGISRNAVWKAVKELQAEGVPIDSGRSGYRLESGYDRLTEAALVEALGYRPEGLRVEDAVTSTNDVLLEEFRKKKTFGDILIAKKQTAGRGRQGRSFVSPQDTGIYISFLLEPKATVEASQPVTTMAAVAAAEAIETVTGLSPRIKWVNDLMLQDRKIAGILTESSFNMETGKPEYIILGIGINTNDASALGTELKDIAGSLTDCGADVPRLKAALAAELIRNVTRYYAHLEETDFRKAYEERLYRLHETVRYKRDEKDDWQEAEIVGIDPRFNLILRTTDGTVNLSCGEIILQKNR